MSFNKKITAVKLIYLQLIAQMTNSLINQLWRMLVYNDFSVLN